MCVLMWMVFFCGIVLWVLRMRLLKSWLVCVELRGVFIGLLVRREMILCCLLISWLRKWWSEWMFLLRLSCCDGFVWVWLKIINCCIRFVVFRLVVWILVLVLWMLERLLVFVSSLELMLIMVRMLLKLWVILLVSLLRVLSCWCFDWMFFWWWVRVMFCVILMIFGWLVVFWCMVISMLRMCFGEELMCSLSCCGWWFLVSEFRVFCSVVGLGGWR